MTKFKEMASAEATGDESVVIMRDGTKVTRLAQYRDYFGTDEVLILFEDMAPRRKDLFLAMLEEYEEFEMVSAPFRSRVMRVEHTSPDGVKFPMNRVLVEVVHE